MSKEYNLTFTDAVKAAISGQFVVGKLFNNGEVMFADPSGEVRVVFHNLKTKQSIRDEYVPLVKKTIEDKYRVIDSFIEIF